MLNRPIRPILGGSGAQKLLGILSSLVVLRRGSPPLCSPEQGSLSRRASTCTILFIPLSAMPDKPAEDWAVAGAREMIRACPVCARDSIIGHGRRRKQAHDENHDWIQIRRGICNLCGTTFTLLPRFSLPYTHYSLVARGQALQRYFAENCSWENVGPSVKDPDRIANTFTLLRRFSSLDFSQPPFSRCAQRSKR